MMSKEEKKSMVWSCVDKKSVVLRKSYGGVKILPGVCCKLQRWRLSYRGTVLKKNSTQENECYVS